MTPLATCPMFHLPPFSCQHWMKSTLHSVLQWNSRTTANGSLGMMIIRYSPRKDTEVYVKKTDTGLLLHYQSHVDEKYKHSLMKTRWKRTFKLSSSWMFFHQECELLKKRFFLPALSWNSRRQVRRSKDNSSRKNNKLQLLINKTLFIIISVVCVLQTMSASRADRYIDVWRNTSYQQSAIT